MVQQGNDHPDEKKIGKHFLDIQTSWIHVQKKGAEAVFSSIKLGQKLKLAKEELKEVEFLHILDFIDITKRTAYRYIKPVNDERITKLTLKQLEKIYNVSRNKLVKMSSLNDTDFYNVLKGRKHDPLEREKCSTDESENTQTDDFPPIPDRMDSETYDLMKKDHKYLFGQYISLFESFKQLVEDYEKETGHAYSGGAL